MRSNESESVYSLITRPSLSIQRKERIDPLPFFLSSASAHKRMPGDEVMGGESVRAESDVRV